MVETITSAKLQEYKSEGWEVRNTSPSLDATDYTLVSTELLEPCKRTAAYIVSAPFVFTCSLVAVAFQCILVGVTTPAGLIMSGDEEWGGECDGPDKAWKGMKTTLLWNEDLLNCCQPCAFRKEVRVLSSSETGRGDVSACERTALADFFDLTEDTSF